jgi:hypothetical protein
MFFSEANFLRFVAPGVLPIGLIVIQNRFDQTRYGELGCDNLGAQSVIDNRLAGNGPNTSDRYSFK